MNWSLDLSFKGSFSSSLASQWRQSILDHTIVSNMIIKYVIFSKLSSNLPEFNCLIFINCAWTICINTLKHAHDLVLERLTELIIKEHYYQVRKKNENWIKIVLTEEVYQIELCSKSKSCIGTLSFNSYILWTSWVLKPHRIKVLCFVDLLWIAMYSFCFFVFFLLFPTQSSD